MKNLFMMFAGSLLTSIGFMLTGVVPLDRAPTPSNAPSVQVSCPTGWKDASDVSVDSIVLACSRGEWIVYLEPDGKTFNNALRDGRGQRVYDPKAVPNWPAQ